MTRITVLRWCLAAALASIVGSTPMFLISSLRTGSSFIYREGHTIYIPDKQTDIWRICPQTNDTLTCDQRPRIQTPACAIITPDCRCYNWNILATETIQQGENNCVYIQIPNQNNITLTWLLDYTYPVLPPGYLFYQQLLFDKLTWPGISFEDYSTITGPLFCTQAWKERVLNPTYDLCEYTYTLNISYIPGSYLTFQPPTTVGRTVLVVFFSLLLGTYGIHFLRRPKLIT